MSRSPKSIQFKFSRQFIKNPETEQFTFEAVLFLAILANFHKSDAAKLNPYMQSIMATSDQLLLERICRAANFSIDAAVKFVL